MKRILCLLYLITLLDLNCAKDSCNLRTAEYGPICVCNSSYCDTVPQIQKLVSGQYQLYFTSKENLGFSSKLGTFTNESFTSTASIIISNLSDTYQVILGFGGAFTDSAGVNIGNLPLDAQEKLLESYFGKNGIQYSLCRVPIGGTDFSERPYTYCDEKDETLGKFVLQKEDLDYKINFIQKAKALRGNESFRLFASAWSSPAWMKTNNKLTGQGYLKEEYYELWVQYYLKFFEAYKQNNISFWGMTTQNEPIDGISNAMINNIGWTPRQMNNWISGYLGPTIRNSSYSDLKIMVHDDQRILLPVLNLLTLSNETVLKYVDGVGVHWYTDGFTPASFLRFAKTNKKDLFGLATEACTGFLHILDLEEAVELGSWERAELYLTNIFDDLEYDFGGWIDWNLALNVSGGPNWVNNPVDSPIIVNETAAEFYKQPMFYALGHFSKFIVPDSVRLEAEITGNRVRAIAFQRPDKKVAIIVWNKSQEDISMAVDIVGSTQVIGLSALSVNTILYSL